jgi:hypothetical protein
MWPSTVFSLRKSRVAICRFVRRLTGPQLSYTEQRTIG